jgi:hypothetical protein
MENRSMSDINSNAEGGVTVASGTTPLFKILRQDEMSIIRHGGGQFAAVDVYELAFFDAAISADEISSRTPVQFYIYHTSDGRAQVRREGGGVDTVVVADSRDPWHIPFEDALRMVGVDYNDETHLGDVVNDFWSALFSPPNDPFEEPSYGVSPWLERNVGDRRSIGSMRPGTAGGEWDDLRLRLRPRKTLNWPVSGGGGGGEPGLRKLMEAVYVWRVEKNPDEAERIALQLYKQLNSGAVPARTAISEISVGRDLGAPPAVEVVQLDLNTVGLRLLEGSPREVGVMVIIRP